MTLQKEKKEEEFIKNIGNKAIFNFFNKKNSKKKQKFKKNNLGY